METTTLPDENNRFVWQNKTYEKLEGKLQVGDLFYFTFCDRVEVYKDVDYGHFDPNFLGCFKVKLIEK